MPTWAWAAPAAPIRPRKRRAWPISSPLLETSIAGAHGVIINITSSPDIGLEDVETAAGLITQSAHPDANIIWGTAFDENLSDEMRVTVVATGFDNKAADGLRSTLGTAAAGTAPGVTASAPSAVFSAEVNTPSCFRQCFCRQARGRGEQRHQLLRRPAGDPEQA